MFSAELSARDHGGHAVVALRGELGLEDAPDIASRLLATVAACGPSIIVDLADLESICDSGLGVLVRVSKWIRACGGVALAAPQQQVRTLLDVTGLIDVFPVYPTVDQAVRGARRAPGGALALARTSGQRLCRPRATPARQRVRTGPAGLVLAGLGGRRSAEIFVRCGVR
jgi:anti-sigma B factor antagonist